jgi:hypothetical protein
MQCTVMRATGGSLSSIHDLNTAGDSGAEYWCFRKRWNYRSVGCGEDYERRTCSCAASDSSLPHPWDTCAGADAMQAGYDGNPNASPLHTDQQPLVGKGVNPSSSPPAQPSPAQQGARDDGGSISRLHTTVIVSTKGLTPSEAFSKYYDSSGDDVVGHSANHRDLMADIPVGNFSEWEVGEAVDVVRSAAVAGMLAVASEARVSGEVLDAAEREVQKGLNASLQLAIATPGATDDREDIVAIRLKQNAVAFRAGEGRDSVYAAAEHAIEALKAYVVPVVKRIWTEASYHGLTNTTRPPVLHFEGVE